MDSVPTIDIRAEGAAEQVHRAVRDVGFLIITGHGVSAEIIAAMRRAASDFFALPQPAKDALYQREGKLNRGYTPFESEFNGSTYTDNAPPDLREGFIYGPFELPNDPYYTAPDAGFAYQDNIWPDARPDIATALRDYYRALEELNRELLEVFAAALDLTPGFFQDKFDRHASTVRLLHYPAPSAPPAEGQLRCGAHTDFGSHTIILADDAPGGLQVRLRDGTWVDVAPPPDSFVVNIGDLMMTWTNDVWLSNLHRVANPPSGGGERFSIAFFCHPNYDALIECIETCRGPDEPPRHQPVRAGEYRLRQVTRITADAQTAN